MQKFHTNIGRIFLRLRDSEISNEKEKKTFYQMPLTMSDVGQ